MSFEPPDQQTLKALFDTVPPTPGNTYELAPVLGGTVSSGAYTAGVLDFLIEALHA